LELCPKLRPLIDDPPPALHLTFRPTKCVHDATNDILYELVAEPVQKQQEGEQLEEAVDQAPKEVANPADLQRKPW